MEPSVLDDLRAGGFFGLGVPERWGGQGGDTRCLVAVLEELAAVSASIATLLSVHLSVAAQPILSWGTDGQRETYLRPLAEGRWLGAFGLTEPSVGSDAAHLATRYVADGAGYVLTGSKMFITNGARADLVLLFATRDPSQGARGISAFLLRKGSPGYSVAQHLDKLGLRGSETTELVLQEVPVPEDRRLGAEGEGLKVALSALTGGRLGISACALGVARAAFETMQENARADPEDWKRADVARAFTDLSAARALVDHGAALKDSGAPFVEVASAAKLFASQAAVRIAHRGMAVAGPAGARAGTAAERLLRDARVFPIVEGTTEIQELILGRALVGR
jgi:alkylation response protein AidB-like acyl-CoA dehydrogenase